MASSFPQIVAVSSYDRFDNLAHGPRGTEAELSLRTFSIDPESGKLTLLSVTTGAHNVSNPAFMRIHPSKNVLYACTESVQENGVVAAWAVNPSTGKLTKVWETDAGGTSTCYLTIDSEAKHMLLVNYWDSSVGVLKLGERDGALPASVSSQYEINPNKASMQRRAKTHVNHSKNDSEAQKDRMRDPHAHAVIIDPYGYGVAYVPDLGMNVIRQFHFNRQEARLYAGMVIPSSSQNDHDAKKPLGPRYIEFHPYFPVAYVINEISSEVAVFKFDSQAAEAMVTPPYRDDISSLVHVQSISTLPEAFPGDLNTCGRITAHQSGDFVICSNRGHDSLTVFRVNKRPPNEGTLSVVCIEHTRGKTPRHFQFDRSGQFLIAANQDSDTIGVFRFNVFSGKLEWTGNQLTVPSPNFVCCFEPCGGASL